MLNVLKYNNNTKKIFIDDYSLLRIAHSNELKNEPLEYLDGFVIDTDNRENAIEIISKIRTRDDVKTGLLPIFVNALYPLPKNILMHTDGMVTLDMIGTCTQRIDAIHKRIHQLQEPVNTSYKEFLHYKFLAYCYTRNRTITPVASRQSLIGYEFPFMSLLFKPDEALSLLQSFEELSTQKLLSFTLKDYIHICKSCSGNYINFRESCPKCDSIDIKAHDMLHHFVCAHVAPEKDFKTQEGLECPKCDKQLRHIGIDYDKPSTIYSCNSCNHEFQNSDMKALCIDCETEHQLDELLEKTIGNYSITKKGEDFILNTNQSSREIGQEGIGNLSIPVFKILLRQEIERIKATGGHSYFVKVHIKNEQLQLLNSSVKSNLAQEIHNIIKSYLTDADMLATQSYNCHYMLLPHTRENKLQRLENIQYNLTKLLSDNLKESTQMVEITYEKIEAENEIHQFIN
ncbi:hypothetical protein [Ascidiimonas aurantiaca]|uniref:TackOD1 domain-containing metal-binding protein n=1 Tax=Ascidiimonas aurantiaca TaxID=1685432 RepID=UPI0030EC3DAC